MFSLYLVDYAQNHWRLSGNDLERLTDDLIYVACGVGLAQLASFRCILVKVFTDHTHIPIPPHTVF